MICLCSKPADTCYSCLHRRLFRLFGCELILRAFCRAIRRHHENLERTSCFALLWKCLAWNLCASNQIKNVKEFLIESCDSWTVCCQYMPHI